MVVTLSIFCRLPSMFLAKGAGSAGTPDICAAGTWRKIIPLDNQIPPVTQYLAYLSSR